MPSLSNNDNNIAINVTTNGDDSGIKSVSTALGGMVDNFQSGMKKISVATGAVAVGLTAFAKSSTDYLTDLVKDSKALATQTGLTVEQSSDLLAVTQRLGLSSATTSVAFKSLSKQIADARTSTTDNSLATADLNNKIQAAKLQTNLLTAEMQKNGDASGLITNKLQSLSIQIKSYESSLSSSTNALTNLGIATQNADGSNKSFNDILLEVSDKFKSMPDGAEKTADALNLFGRSGTSMIKVLDLGSQGITDLEQKAQDLGLTLTAQNIGAVSDYITSQKNLKDTTDSLKIAVGSLTAPVMTKFNDVLNSTLQGLIGVHSPFRAVIADAIAFGGPILAATSSVTAFLGNLDSALPLLKSMGLLLANPIFILFAAAVAGITLSVIQLHDKLGDWGKVMQVIGDKLKSVGDQIKTALLPTFLDLWNTLETKVLPTLLNLWKNVIEPLLPVLGVALVAAIQVVVGTFTALLNVITPVINFLINHRQAVLDFAVAFTVLAVAMNFDSITSAFMGNMSMMLTKIGSVKTSVVELFTTISGGTVMGGIATAGALADIALVMQAIQSVIQALNDMNNAQTAISKAADQADSIKDIEAKYKSGKLTKTQETNAINAILKGVDSAESQVNPGKSGGSGFATGTNNAPSGWSWVGEKGPELMKLRGGEQIKDAQTSAGMAGSSGNQNYFSGSIVLGDSTAVQEFFKQINQDTLLASKGMTIRQGN